MPCREEAWTVEQEARMKRDRHAVTRLACDRCAYLERNGDEIPEWAVEWWEAHKAADRERERRERLDKEGQKLIAAIKGRLSPEMLAYLGLQ